MKFRSRTFPQPQMIINAETALTHLRKKVRPDHSDDSRHLLCPLCRIRTKLNTLGDGRRKCTTCGKKFRINKATDAMKLKQCAEILLCFCLDFSPHKTAQITRHRYRLVAAYYDHFRRLIAEKSLPPEKLKLLTLYKENTDVMPHNKNWCRWCQSKIRSQEAGGRTPVFGVEFRRNDEVYIDPLKDDEAVLYFHTLSFREEAPGAREGYAGFICCGRFHRFTEDARAKLSAEQLWNWIRERVRSHHGIWKRNTGFYLKELEWKYNNKDLDLDLQASKFIELMPVNFLTSWSMKTKEKPAAVV